MGRGLPYETSTTCKKEGKMSVKRRILRSIILSRYSSLYLAFQTWTVPSLVPEPMRVPSGDQANVWTALV